MADGKERVSQSLPAGTSPLQTADASFALLDLLQKRRENELLDEKFKERQQVLKTLQQQADDLKKEIEKGQELHTSDCSMKEQAASLAAEREERGWKEVNQLQEELERLKVECATLRETKEEMQRQVDRHAVYKEYLEAVVKMTKFDDIQAFTDHCEILLHFRDLLYQTHTERQGQVHQQKKALLVLEDMHRILRLHKINQLSQLQTELVEIRSKAYTWERQWNRIQETAAKKTLLLGQIKIATHNLYEMTEDKAGKEEAVDINDTEKQLDKVKMFIQDHEDIMKKLQAPAQRDMMDRKKPSTL